MSYRVEAGALVESEGPGRTINWASDTNAEIANIFGVSNAEVARCRPAEYCRDVEDFAGFVGVEGRKIPAIRRKEEKPKKAAKKGA